MVHLGSHLEALDGGGGCSVSHLSNNNDAPSNLRNGHVAHVELKTLPCHMSLSLENSCLMSLKPCTHVASNLLAIHLRLHVQVHAMACN